MSTATEIKVKIAKTKKMMASAKPPLSPMGMKAAYDRLDKLEAELRTK